MLNYFPNPYEDELLYSIIARYHYYSGNVSPTSTLMDLFGSSQIRPSLLLTYNLELLSQKLVRLKNFGSECFLDKHTLYPLVDLFIPESRKVNIINEIKNNNGKNIVSKLKVLYEFHDSKLKYCPICALEDFNSYGEGYFHRMHQVFGVKVCPQHESILLEYPVDYNEKRNYFIRFDVNKIDLREWHVQNNYNSYHFLRVAKCVRDILAAFPTGLDNYKVYQRYLSLLSKKGLLKYTGQVNREIFVQEFKSFYKEELLYPFHANLENDDPNNWLYRITRKPNWTIHPIKHILLILFLCNDFNEFLNTEPYSYKPFGDGPWLCLNPIADHYKKQVVSTYRIKFNSQRQMPIGYFTCSCGFTYRRIGFDKGIGDSYVGEVVDFGQVWEEKLKELLMEKKYPITVLASKMSCHYRTVLRYADKLGLRHLINTTIRDTRYKPFKRTVNQELKTMYENAVLNYIKQHPSCSRNEIFKNLVKQSSWLEKYDKDWFERNLPCKLSRGTPKGKKTNWEERDKEYVYKLRKLVKEIRDKEIFKLTKSSLSQRIGKKSIILANLDKLPKTKQFLEKVSEDDLSYNLRKVDYLCKKIFTEKGKFTRSDITKKIGIYDNKKIDERIEANLDKYIRFRM